MMVIALITTLSFTTSNIAAVFMVQAENRSRPVLAGIFESIYALLFIVGAKYSVTIGGSDHARTYALIGAIIIGNFTGAYIGTKLGDKYLRDEDEEATLERIAETETALSMAHQALEELEHEIELHHEDGEGH